MEFVVKVKGVGIAPKKVRKVCDLIRKESVSVALDILRFSPKKEIALVLTKAINNGLDQAVKSEKQDIDLLIVKKIFTDEGKTLKRYQPRAQGRAFPIRKRSSHITVSLAEK